MTTGHSSRSWMSDEPLEMDFLRHYGLTAPLVAQLREVYGPLLLPLQQQALRASGLMNGEHLAVYGPTSSGKTLVGELACLRQIHQNRCALYLVPTRALANEKAAHWARVYGELGLRVVLSTGDYRADDARLIAGRYHLGVVVYEKLLALLTERPALLEPAGAAVLDEAQILFDPERGPHVELLLTRLRRARRLQLVALSALMLNQRLAEWLGAREICDGRRPVPLRQGVLHRGVFHYRDLASGERGMERLLDDPPEGEKETILRTALRLAESGESTLVFLPTKYVVAAWAQEAAGRSQLPRAERALAALCELPDGMATRLLRALAERGIAIHHGDLTPAQRRWVEEHARSGELRLVWATSTLAEGVNLPTVNTLVFRDVVVGGGGDAARGLAPWVARLPPARFHNMTGRSGRLGHGRGGPGFGRGMLTAEDGADVETMLRHYLECPLEPAEPHLWRWPLERTVAWAVAETGSARLDKLLPMLEETFSAYIGLGRWSPADIGRALDTLAKEGLLTHAGEPELTAAGRVTVAFGTQPATARCLAEALEWLDDGVAPLLCLLRLALTPDGQSVYAPLTRIEREEQLPLRRLAHWAAEQGLERQPIVSELLEAEYWPPERLAAIKKALALADWISPLPTVDVETRHGLLAGALARIAERFGWLADAWRALALLRGRGAAAKRLRALSAALGCGVPLRAAALAPLTRHGLDRSHILALLAAGARTPREAAALAAQGGALEVPKCLLIHALQALKLAPAPASPPPDAPAAGSPRGGTNFAAPSGARHTAKGAILVRFDPERPEIFHVGASVVPCTPTERRLLACVLAARGGTVPWEDLHDRVWGRDQRVVGQETAYKHKSNLNRKVAKATMNAVPELLTVVPTYGLRLHVSLLAAEEAARR